MLLRLRDHGRWRSHTTCHPAALDDLAVTPPSYTYTYTCTVCCHHQPLSPPCIALVPPLEFGTNSFSCSCHHQHSAATREYSRTTRTISQHPSTLRRHAAHLRRTLLHHRVAGLTLSLIKRRHTTSPPSNDTDATPEVSPNSSEYLSASQHTTPWATNTPKVAVPAQPALLSSSMALSSQLLPPPAAAAARRTSHRPLSRRHPCAHQPLTLEPTLSRQ